MYVHCVLQTCKVADWKIMHCFNRMAEQQGVPVKDSDLTQWKEKKNQGKLAAQQLHLQCED